MIFKEPSSTNNWASKAVLGERVWLNRKNIPIPPHHSINIPLLAINSAIGVLPLAWGLLTYALWPTLFGIAWTLGFKSWFNDRMVLLYEEMRKTNSEYQSWLYDKRG
jgi:hypothetical protein